MRIGVNALAVSPRRPGGDVRYVIELVRRLPKLAPEVEWRVFATRAAAPLIGELPSNARYVNCQLPSDSIVVRALWEQSVLPRLAKRAGLDVLHAPVNVAPIGYTGATLLTLHEAEPFMPDSGIPMPLLAWWRTMRSISAQRARCLLTVSDAARDQIVRWMRLDPARIRAVHLGLDHSRYSSSARDEPSPHSGSYILWVGRPYPRKNLDVLLSAFAELRKAGRTERLVLLGPPGWNEAKLRRRILSNFETGTVLRYPAVWRDLPRWYAHASVFAFPSSQETFGLPVLEAMACGTPVVAGDIPALREVGGAAAVYVSPSSAQDLARAIEQALSAPDDARRYGLERAAHFDWDVTAAKTLEQLRAAAVS